MPYAATMSCLIERRHRHPDVSWLGAIFKPGLSAGVAEDVALDRVERGRGRLEILVGQSAENLLVQAMTHLAHARDQWLALWLEKHAVHALAGGIGFAPQQARLLEPVDRSACCDLAEFEFLGQPRLRHAVLAREVGRRPPLRACQVERVETTIERAAAQRRDIVGQQAQAQFPIDAVGVNPGSFEGPGVRDLLPFDCIHAASDRIPGEDVARPV